MNLAALIVSITAITVSAWSVNHQRLIHHWTRDRFTSPMPKLWHVRYRPGIPPLSFMNVEMTASKLSAEEAERLKQQFRNRFPTSR